MTIGMGVCERAPIPSLIVEISLLGLDEWPCAGFCRYVLARIYPSLEIPWIEIRKTPREIEFEKWMEAARLDRWMKWVNRWK
jgi:hypothetical protein